jgi:prepilin-type processing-associated H-X9-DG protein
VVRLGNSTGLATGTPRTMKLSVLGLLSLAVLTGCVTTQQENARTVLLNDRTLASETAVSVRRENPAVRVTALSVLRAQGRAGDVLIVGLFNSSPRPLTDLPISIGVVSPDGRRVYLNGGANIAYYDTHVPAVAAHSEAAWVLPGLHPPFLKGRPFAEVGVAHLPPTTTERTLPKIDASLLAVPRSRQRHGQGTANGTVDALVISLHNRSGVPQYGLQVYAIAYRGGRPVGAARIAVANLDGGGRTTIPLRLIGSAAGAAIHLSAPATIFA